MLLQDRVAVISGAAAAKGIRHATAQLSAEHGATVAVLDFGSSRPGVSRRLDRKEAPWLRLRRDKKRATRKERAVGVRPETSLLFFTSIDSPVKDGVPLTTCAI